MRKMYKVAKSKSYVNGEKPFVIKKYWRFGIYKEFSRQYYLNEETAIKLCNKLNNREKKKYE